MERKCRSHAVRTRSFYFVRSYHRAHIQQVVAERLDPAIPIRCKIEIDGIKRLRGAEVGLESNKASAGELRATTTGIDNSIAYGAQYFAGYGVAIAIQRDSTRAAVRARIDADGL